MTYTVFKNKIRKKFGSIQRFMTLTGVTQNDIDKAKDCDKRLKRLLAKGDKVKNTIMPDRDLTPELLEKIRIAIYTKYKRQTEFCFNYPTFGFTWLSALLNGKYKRKSTKVKLLIEILEIK